MTGAEIFAIIYATVNIGLLCSIKFDQGMMKQKTDDNERRIAKIEGKIA